MRPARWRLTVAILVPLVAVVVTVVLADRVRDSAAREGRGPLVLSAVPQPGATGAICTELDRTLPAELAGLARRELYAPEPGVAAWGDPPVVLRCGITEPADLTCSTPLTVFNGVAWHSQAVSGATTFVVVDRPVRIALTLGNSVGIGPVQAMSNLVREVADERPVCVEGLVNPVPEP